MNYGAYLASAEWHATRRNAIRRAFGHCQNPDCPNGYRRSLTAEEILEIDQGRPFVLHVHHLTYDRIGRELDDDLIVLCVDCHRSVHGLPPAPGLNGDTSIGAAVEHVLKILAHNIRGEKPP